MDSRVRRNLDKPCPSPIPNSKSSHENVQGPSDQMKNNRRYSNMQESPSPEVDGQQDKGINGGFSENETPRPSAREEDHFDRMMDVSPSVSCNASQMLMKSLMTSYNAGNTKFYENLHKKYFDKAKGAKKDGSGAGGIVDPPNLLDITGDDQRREEELSRFMADSRLMNDERSRSRSRSRGATSNNMLQGCSKVSSVNMAAFSKFKGGSSNHALPNEGGGFHTVKEMRELDQQTQGAHTAGLDDDTHLFELTEKSNNTYMGLSYWNQTSNTVNVGGEAGLTGHGGIYPSTTPHTATQGATTPEQMTQREAIIAEERNENEEENSQRNKTQQHHPVDDMDSSNNAMSINFKNSIYSKIKFDPSVHNLAPSMISARHQPMHSDVSASQISIMGLTSKILGRNGVTYRNAGSVEDNESEVPGRSFLTRQKLLSSSSSPEIDIDEVMRRNQQHQTRSRLGSNRGNKSVPNIHEVKDGGDSQHYGNQYAHHQRDEMSRRDLSARFEEEGQEVTNFEMGTQRSGTRKSSDESPIERQAQVVATRQDVMPQATTPVITTNFNDQTRKTDFSEKVYNLMSPDNMQFNNPHEQQQQKAQRTQQQPPFNADDTSSSFLRQLQNLGSPDDKNDTSNMSYKPHHLLKQHQFLQTEQFAANETDEKNNRQYSVTNGTTSTAQAEPQTLREDKNLPRQQQIQQKNSSQKSSLKPTDLELLQMSQQSEEIQDNPSLLQAFQEQVRIARARHNSQTQLPNGAVEGLTTDQQAQLIRQQFESVPSMPKSQLLQQQQHLHHHNVSKNHQENSVSNLDGDGHRSDFTFVLSQPTHGAFTECHNCGANGSIILDNTNVNGSILQRSHGLRSSIGDTSMQIRKKVLTNFYSNGLPIPPSSNQPQQQHQQQNNSNYLPHGGTASFPEGILNNNNNTSGNMTNFQSAKSSEPRMNPHQFPTNGNTNHLLPQENSSEALVARNHHPSVMSSNGGRLRNRLPEIAASPIYSESGGVPGRKFFMSINQHQNQNQGGGLICHNENEQLRLSQIQNPASQQDNGGAQQVHFTDPSSPPPSSHEQNLLQFQSNQQMHQQQIDDRDQAQLLQSQNEDHDNGGEPQNLHELFSLQQQELNHARNLLICTFDYLQRALHGQQQTGQWAGDLQDEAFKLMQVIQGATMIGGDDGNDQQWPPQQHQQIQLENYNRIEQRFSSFLYSQDHNLLTSQNNAARQIQLQQQQMQQQYGQMIPEAAIENEEEQEHDTVDTSREDRHHNVHENQQQQQQRQHHHHQVSEQRNGQDYEEEDTQVVQDSARQQMTESEIKDERLGHIDKVFLMPKQVAVQNFMLDQSTTESQYQPEQHDQQLLDQHQQNSDDKNHLEIKHLESNKQSAGGDLKNSLLSSNVQDNTLYDLDKDTVYSFFAEESEIRPRPRNKRGQGNSNNNNHMIEDGQTSFIASRSPREYRRKPSNNRNRQGEEENQDGDDLTKTKTQLKTEKRVNREQADKLKQMQAQIDMLTHKWSITENQLRNNGAMYSMMQQPAVGGGAFTQASAWHPTATSLTQNIQTQRALNPAAYYSVLGGAPHQATTSTLLDRQKSTLTEMAVPNKTNTMPFSSPMLEAMPRANTTPSVTSGGFPSPYTGATTQTQQQQAAHQQPTPQMAHAIGFQQTSSHQSSSTTVLQQRQLDNQRDQQMSQQNTSVCANDAADQSKNLIELNQRLTQQIENNIQILDNLGQDQISQQPSSLQQQQQMQQKQHQQLSMDVHSLGSIDHQNAENVQSLITLTKITAEASSHAHSQHKEEMEKLRKRQLAFTAKIDKIGSKLSQQTKPDKNQAGAAAPIKTRVGLKATIRATSSSLVSRQGTIDEQNQQRVFIEEGDGNNSSTFLDLTSDDKVPTKD